MGYGPGTQTEICTDCLRDFPRQYARANDRNVSGGRLGKPVALAAVAGPVLNLVELIAASRVVAKIRIRII